MVLLAQARSPWAGFFACVHEHGPNPLPRRAIKAWTDVAWDDYLWWQTQDRKTLRRINALIRDIDRSPFEGIGKPEPLKFDLSGLWSRRIDQANRLVYEVADDTVLFHTCRDHY